MKAGIIGELGCTTNITPNEEKVLKAGARAQRITGASISIHPGSDASVPTLTLPGYSKESPFTVINILEREGADLSRVIIGHIDRGILELDDMITLAKRGTRFQSINAYSKVVFWNLINLGGAALTRMLLPTISPTLRTLSAVKQSRN